MNIQFEINQQSYQSDLSKGHSIAITLLPNGNQPNHFGAPECNSEPLIAGDFIGDTKQGGSCNVNRLSIIPHCNGTHTESVSHVIDQLIPVHKVIEKNIFPCVLISIKPICGGENTDLYQPNIDPENKVIQKAQLKSFLDNFSNQQLEGLVIRTLPNLTEKKVLSYDQKNYPAFLTNCAMNYLHQRGVKHLLVDFPSVDKMYDEGMLSNHRIFWQLAPGQKSLEESESDEYMSLPKKTITEMVYIDEKIQDGFYLCNLQVPEIETDAVPSQPTLYPVSKNN
ncbi:MAG: cyclase family protein [Kangiellaceae bacterium]|nr:cyclase family protein [Kangiellaceae bacterium]